MTERITRVLIANRGEIVIRIARTARRMGIETVAVFSDSDRGAPHVQACDHAIPIGGLAPSESYLQAEKILGAAREVGADAIHPGYGFLSENAAFADAVVRSGLTWIGPPADAIAAMGDKARARVRAVAARLPVTPGYDGEDQSEAQFIAQAEQIGFPIMVKASAGGGGRGMRLVSGAAELTEALASARSEAEKAFGDGRLLLEKAILSPRHVEIQLFADQRGAAVHLFERDCSVQRRHQKVIEEAPCPVVDPLLREEMGQAAIAIAKDVGYVGAGTVEFLLDRDRRFYFMEMNTRLQVEHPVTELITGLDLVEWQFRIARGEPLPLRQEQVTLEGCAIEARLCAEDPVQDYSPRTGRVGVWRPPHAARSDDAIAEGLEISPFFDSMLGKIIVHGKDRAEACARLGQALDQTILLGVPTNRGLLARIVRDPVFRAGEAVSTAFLAERFAEPADRMPRPGNDAWAIAAWLSVTAKAERWDTPASWRDWSSSGAIETPWKLGYEEGGQAVERQGTAILSVGSASIRGSGFETTIEGVVGRAGETFSVVCGNRRYRCSYCWEGDFLWFNVAPLSGQCAEGTDFVIESRRLSPPGGGQQAKDATKIFAPMNGRLVAMRARAGGVVKAGDILAVVEAMKMEHALPAGVDARITAVHVAEGAQVAPRQLLIELEPLDKTA